VVDNQQIWLECLHGRQTCLHVLLLGGTQPGGVSRPISVYQALRIVRQNMHSIALAANQFDKVAGVFSAKEMALSAFLPQGVCQGHATHDMPAAHLQ
jgi:hypothetical protein